METYRCDSCGHEMPYEEASWFTSTLGFCDKCFDKLYETLTPEEYDDLYNRCESGDDSAAEIVVNATR